MANIYGTLYNDTLHGTNYADKALLYGYSGNDTIWAGLGNGPSLRRFRRRLHHRG